jgi:hypothetical protein
LTHIEERGRFEPAFEAVFMPVETTGSDVAGSGATGSGGTGANGWVSGPGAATAGFVESGSVTGALLYS